MPDSQQNLNEFFIHIFDSYVKEHGIDKLIERVKAIKLDQKHIKLTGTESSMRDLESAYLCGYLNHYWKHNKDKVPNEEWVAHQMADCEKQVSWFTFESEVKS